MQEERVAATAACPDDPRMGDDVQGQQGSPAVEGFLAAGSPRAVIDAAQRSVNASPHAVLALMLETEGSTYAGAGAMVLFDGDNQVGWVSGGCLEPELAQRAGEADEAGRVGWIEIDTREDEHLLSGSALGCRGRLRIALLPLRLLAGSDAVFAAWLRGSRTLRRQVGIDGSVALAAGSDVGRWRLPAGELEWQATSTQWDLPLPPLPRLLLFGAGPETGSLLRLLRDLGWQACIVERRPRWCSVCEAADAFMDTTPESAIRDWRADAALVMHHDFERDREALAALSETDIGFIGLLGPERRREDLFKLLPAKQRERLSSRLHSPVGLDLGGRGPEAIALSIAAQLQDWRARNGTG